MSGQALSPAASSPGPWWVLGMCLAVSAASSAAAVLAYHATRPAPPRLATLNVAQLFNERQEELMKLVAGGGEAATQKAMEAAQAFGKELEAQVLALPKECGCIVLVRGAVVAGGELPDYTDVLRQRLRGR
ncbi:MAG: type-F conjugative transfer system protein TrbI [Candidatus Rokubacteria bacterium]|nr:type-F conjugative transfer system protein TrbI [Candidatus Rokubacteria bacterium]